MNRQKISTLLIILIVGVSSFVFGQTNRLKRAQAAFDNKEYPQAVRNYEELLTDRKITAEDQKAILSNLGLSYKNLHDYRNAERIYRQLFKSFEKELSAEVYLQFAQVLAGNAKYKESQKIYSQYGERQTNDLRGGKFAIAYMDNSKFFKDSAMYDIKYLEKFNTRFSDFAPMYYENGLVFVSARKDRTVIRRVFNQDETPFLDLYIFPDSTMTYIPDSSAIGEKALAELGGSAISTKTLGTQTTPPTPANNDIEVDEFSKKLNSKYHEGPVTFSRDFKNIIFTRNNYSKGKVLKNERGINMLKLYMADKKGEKWTNIRELPFNSNNFSTGHPAFSPENHRLYFVSDMPGGYGGTDLYYVDYLDGQWSLPINLGREVNTEGNEMFPYIDQYGNMYFASDGHAGLGGLDVFYVEMRNGIPASEVENLGAPINSEKDDFGLITDGHRQQGYFSSNRKRGFSDDNIYSFVRGCNELKLKIYDNETQAPIANAEVRLIKNGVNRSFFTSDEDGLASLCLEAGTDFYFKVFKDGYDVGVVTYGTLSRSLAQNQIISVFLKTTVIPLVRGRVISEFDHSPIVAAQVFLENLEDGSIETVVTGLDGRYTFQPTKGGQYIVKTVKENLVAVRKTEIPESKVGANQQIQQSSKVNQPVSKQTVTPKEAEVSMLAVGDILQLENIYYSYGKASIRPEGKKELDKKVLPLLQNNPQLRIELRSHTDSRSSAEFNLTLSQKRANEVKTYLMQNGIESSRIIARGYGKSELLNECDTFSDCSPQQHAQNRRTEIKIINIAEHAAR